MKYLVDTHYILWTLFEPGKIKKEIKEILEDKNKIKLVSGISLWEISLKYSLGKLVLEGTNPDEIKDKICESGFILLPVDNDEFSSYYKLPRKENHKDPFDRMLVWQAITKNITLLTNDKKIEQYVENGLKIITGR